MSDPKQNPKKKNHEVTKGLLKRWRNESGQLWTFDIESQKIESRSLEATFAIQDYLYVPEIGGKRDDSVENWFSGAEDKLIHFVRRLDSKQYETPIKGQDLYLTILGLVGLSLRSAYDLKSIDAQLRADASLGTLLGVDVSTEALRHRFVVENMINQITEQAKLYMQASVTTRFEAFGSLLICDRPGADFGYMEKGIYFIPVGPNEYVYMDLSTPPPAAIYGATFAKAGPEIDTINSINAHTISRARNWVVAKTRVELEAVADNLAPDKVAKRKLSDKISHRPLSEEERKRGWRMKDPEKPD